MRRRPGSGACAVGLLLVCLAPGCKKKATVGVPMSTFDEGMDHLSQRKLRQAVATLKRIEFMPETRDRIEPLARLGLADATFYQGTSLGYIDARGLYLDFVTLHGDHRQAPYAQTQVGFCSLQQVNHPSKDQTETHKAIDDLSQVERRWPNSPFVGAANLLLREARSNLAESEFIIGKFYLKKKQYGAAIDRFDRVVTGFPDYPEIETVYYYLGTAHLRAGNDLESRVYMNRVVTDYPGGKYRRPAAKRLASLDAKMKTELADLDD